MNKDICRDKKLCTGCTACASICPKNCIKMVDDNEGFLYPYVDESNCVNCGLCEKTCPVNNPPATEDVIEGYVARYKDLKVVADSTSGGSFSAFADYTFKKGGFVYGVGYDSDMRVKHFGINASEKKRVEEMRGSKYVQSDLGECFSEIKSKIDAGHLVCFSGTPCQVAGLKGYLRKDYENLITIDLVCHGVASPLVFRKYVEYQTAKYKSKINKIKFRNKTYGYHSGTMMVSFDNGKQYFGSGRIDYMLKAYFKGASSRYSCYQCPFKGNNRCSDFTIFDSWHIEQLVEGCKDDDRGYTNIFVHTQKGKKILNELDTFLTIWQSDTDKMKKLDGIMIDNNPRMAKCRDVFISELNTKSLQQQIQTYLPVTLKDHLIERMKSIIYKMGILRLLKK